MLEDLFDGKTPQNCRHEIIEWRDIRTVTGWSGESAEDIRPCRRLSTSGWVIYDGEDPEDPGQSILVVGHSYDAEEEVWTDFTVFPRTVIRRQWSVGGQNEDTMPWEWVTDAGPREPTP